MTTDVAVRSGAAVPAQEWFLISAQADELARSDIIPSAYRRKPSNIIVAALTGRPFGWDVLTAMRNGHVIEGTWGMKPEAMLGLVRAAGHSVSGMTNADGAQLKGKRADNGDEMVVTFSIEDAQRAGLANKGTWKSYPQMMCYWRAAGLLCRMLFSDVTLGVHTVEELGATLSPEGDVIEADHAPLREREPEPLSDENLARFNRACESEGLEPERVLDEAFGEGVRPVPLTDADLPAMRDAFARLSQAAQPPEPAGVGTPPPPAPAGTSEPDEGDPTLPGVRTLPATRSQVGKIKGEYTRLGVEDRITQLSHSSELLGGLSLSTHNGLTRGQAHQLIELLTMTETLG
jgi:hypothetical protein